MLDLVFNKLNGKECRYSLFKDNEKSRRLLRPYFFEFNKEYKIVRSWDNKEFISEEFILTKENYHKNKGSWYFKKDFLVTKNISTHTGMDSDVNMDVYWKRETTEAF